MSDLTFARRPGSPGPYPDRAQGVGVQGWRDVFASAGPQPGCRSSLCDQIAHWSLELGLYSQVQRRRRRVSRVHSGGQI
jgi:hypothetical protein